MTLSKSKNNFNMIAPKLRGSLETQRYPALADVKLDGELNWLLKSNGNIILVNKHHNIRSNFDFEELFFFYDATVKAIKEARQIALIGELVHGSGRNGNLYELLKDKKNEKKRLTFVPFDILSLNHYNMTNQSLLDRREFMVRKGIETMPTRYVETQGQVDVWFRQWTSHGYEGIVVKHINDKYPRGTCSWTKVKYKDKSFFPLHSLDGYLERGDILVNHRKVGVKISNKYKQQIQNYSFTNNNGTSFISGVKLEIEHQGILAGGGLRHPVFTGWIENKNGTQVKL